MLYFLMYFYLLYKTILLPYIVVVDGRPLLDADCRDDLEGVVVQDRPGVGDAVVVHHGRVQEQADGS